MDNRRQKKYLKELEFYTQKPDSSGFRLMVAICHTQLGNFVEARNNYQQTLEGGKFQGKPGFTFFVFTGEVEKLCEVFILAGQPKSFAKIWKQQMESYRLDSRSDAVIPQYAFALQCLIENVDEQAEQYIRQLLKKPKYKDTFATGQVIEAIVSRDQTAFDQAMVGLIKAHRGMAKYGSLRETPLGFLSLSAMGLSKMALDRGMSVNVESEYLPRGYLNYLVATSS
jgi:hypothetical protein